MKVIFLVPNWREHQIKHTNVTINPPVTMPLEFMYIISNLNNQITYKIIDSYLNDMNFDALKIELDKFQPELVVLSSSVSYLQWRCPPLDLSIPKKIVEFCTTKNYKTLLIGPHGTVEPSETLSTVHATFLIRGEPEIVVADFINSKLTKLDLKGLYTENIDNGVAAEVDLKNLNKPSINSVEIKKYENYTWSETLKRKLEDSNIIGSIMEVSRGCIYNCVFCLRDGFRKSYRTKSIEIIIDELIELKSNNVGYIYFIDEIFNVESEILFETLKVLKQQNILFGCQARPDIMSKKLLNLFYESGCIYIEYGLESYDEDVLNRITKNIDLDYIDEIIDYSKKLFGKDNISIALINFYSKDIMEILNLKKRKKWYSKVIRPYPGSELGNKIISKYNVLDHKWEFILKYNWWLQIENFSLIFKDDNDKSEAIKNKILFSNFDESYKCSDDLLNEYMIKIKNLRKTNTLRKKSEA